MWEDRPRLQRAQQELLLLLGRAAAEAWGDCHLRLLPLHSGIQVGEIPSWVNKYAVLGAQIQSQAEQGVAAAQVCSRVISSTRTEHLFSGRSSRNVSKGARS